MINRAIQRRGIILHGIMRRKHPTSSTMTALKRMLTHTIVAFWVRRSVCHSTIHQIRPQQRMERNRSRPHHRISDDVHGRKARQDLADLSNREPAHIAATGRVGRIDADAAAVRHGAQERLPVLT